MKIALLALALGACVPPSNRPACTYERLAEITATCIARKKIECADAGADKDCPVIAHCDRLIDEWRVCQ